MTADRFQAAIAYQRVNDDPTLRIAIAGPLDAQYVLAQCLQCGAQANLLSSYQAIHWCEQHRCSYLMDHQSPEDSHLEVC